jgi:hypothetical protein
MTTFPRAVFLTALFITSTSAIAATDTKTINVRVTQGTFAELTGSAVDGHINTVNMNNIESNASVSLGTLGVKSNGDNCALKFSSLNDFSLIHDTSGSLLKRYQLSYLGHHVASNSGPTIALDSCVISTQILTFNTYGNMPDTVEEGWYQDRVTITLTAE